MKKLILKDGDTLFDSALSQGQMQSVLGGVSGSGSGSGNDCGCNANPANLACNFTGGSGSCSLT